MVTFPAFATVTLPPLEFAVRFTAPLLLNQMLPLLLAVKLPAAVTIELVEAPMSSACVAVLLPVSFRLTLVPNNVPPPPVFCIPPIPEPLPALLDVDVRFIVVTALD